MEKFTVEIWLPLDASHTFPSGQYLTASQETARGGTGHTAGFNKETQCENGCKRNILEGQNNRKKVHCEGTVPRSELDGQSSQHRHRRRRRCHQVGCAPWAKPQPAKSRNPLEGQILSPACASDRGGGRKQLCHRFCSPFSHQSPHLAAFSPESPPWQGGTLSGGTMDGWAQVQWPGQVQLRSTLLNWGS